MVRVRSELSPPRDLSDRLDVIERVLARAERPALPESDDTVALLTAAVPLGRVAELTSILNESADAAVDGVDAIAIRLLLSDYLIAVAHLRAAARLLATRVDETSETVASSRRILEREERSLANSEGTKRG